VLWFVKYICAIMILTIEVSDVQAAALKAQAEAQGLTVERWLQKIAENHVPSQSIAHLQDTNPREWARRFHEWAEGHDGTTPLLSDEAISRESIYPDRI
jgi:hypothetical protein